MWRGGRKKRRLFEGENLNNDARLFVVAPRPAFIITRAPNKAQQHGPFPALIRAESGETGEGTATHQCAGCRRRGRTARPQRRRTEGAPQPRANPTCRSSLAPSCLSWVSVDHQRAQLVRLPSPPPRPPPPQSSPPSRSAGCWSPRRQTPSSCSAPLEGATCCRSFQRPQTSQDAAPAC